MPAQISKEDINALTKLRQSKGYSQKELAQITKISESTVRRCEKGLGHRKADIYYIKAKSFLESVPPKYATPKQMAELQEQQQALGWSSIELAEKLNINPNTFAPYGREERRVPYDFYLKWQNTLMQMGNKYVSKSTIQQLRDFRKQLQVERSVLVLKLGKDVHWVARREQGRARTTFQEAQLWAAALITFYFQQRQLNGLVIYHLLALQVQSPEAVEIFEDELCVGLKVFYNIQKELHPRAAIMIYVPLRKNSLDALREPSEQESSWLSELNR